MYKALRVSVVASYLGLVAWLAIWALAINPTMMSAWALAALWVLPLSLAAPGLLRGVVYTHSWMSLLVLFYFAFTLSEAVASPAHRDYALIAAMLSLWLFTACVLYPKVARRHAAH